MVATRSSGHAAPRKANIKPARKQKAMIQHKKTWVPGKRNFYRYQHCSSCDITQEDGEVVTVSPGSHIIVLQWEPNMSPAEIDPNTYWRAIVREIRNSKNGRTWLKVSWFYSREHLLQPGILDEQCKGIPLMMENNELALSNHEDIIGSKSVNGVQEISYLDDVNPYHHRIALDWFFWRLTLDAKMGLILNVNLTCNCGTIYSPSQGRQRFCVKCGMWNHERCSQVLQEQSLLEGENELEKLSNLPIVRGWNANTHSSWELTGSGYRVAAVREWLRTGDVPHNWKKKVNNRWVDEVLGKMWSRYACHQCGGII
ncbi:hypothetical protein F5887DRAFT_1086013 [Amanita rubescens]|nr:hypothetical protein F5887DRAFT_1086013 [Amanita rubescens]